MMSRTDLLVADRPTLPTATNAAAGGSAVHDLAAAIGAALDGPAMLVPARIVAAVRRAVGRPDLLTPPQCQPRIECYARHLIHADPAGRFTILAIVWGPGQFSPVHAHHTWCAYAVRSQVLTETLFRLDPDTSIACPASADLRHPGYACYAEAGMEQVHRLGNAHDQPAISVHVYGVGGGQISTGVNRIVPVT